MKRENAFQAGLIDELKEFVYNKCIYNSIWDVNSLLQD